MAISWEESIIFFLLNQKEIEKMKKTIYKITNLINQKSYIGQTTDFKRRVQEHRAKGYGSEKNKILYYAFDKYGIENFSFEILEENIENYNEREIYWIEFYKTLVPNGYNMSIGGEEPPHKVGEEHQYATHKQIEVNEIIDLLINTNKTTKEIAAQYNYHPTAIIRINNGQIWHNPKLAYPLRKELSEEFKEKRALSISYDLLFTDLSQKEIAKKYGVGRTTVTAINCGQNHRQEDFNYPLRSPNEAVRNIKVEKCDQSGNTLETFSTIKEAACSLNISTKTITIESYLRKKLKENSGEVNLYGFIWRIID